MVVVAGEVQGEPVEQTALNRLFIRKRFTALLEQNDFLFIEQIEYIFSRSPLKPNHNIY